jgi:hypothetical protein
MRAKQPTDLLDPVLGILIGGFEATVVFDDGFHAEYVLELQDLGDGISMEIADPGSVFLMAVSELDQLNGGEFTLHEIFEREPNHGTVVDEDRPVQAASPIRFDQGQEATDALESLGARIHGEERYQKPFRKSIQKTRKNHQ